MLQCSQLAFIHFITAHSSGFKDNLCSDKNATNGLQFL